ncbi:unnamed protein product [Cuscuta campestris]|uniref:DUF7356 domain-containing protein n=2 Tax=Cuscuta sect. Cleistogrammica TaxID=1824901 RepID=A0A484MKA3_9ASTE|nr:hypothetical protein DM860_002755 [Cuscuta australis]VFQ89280.1 unnamed protein product [Cuscuta campestris]
MGKNGRLFVIILVFLIVSCCSSAFNSTTNSSSIAPQQGSQVNETVSGIKGLNESLGIGKEKPKETQRSEDLSIGNVKGSNNGSNTAVGTPPSKSKGNEEKKEVENASKDKDNESCEGALQECSIENTLLACIQVSRNGSKEPFLVLRNDAESKLEVKIYSSNSVGQDPVAVNKHQIIRVNISSTLSKGSKIVVDTGSSGRCELQLGQSVASMDSFVQQLSLYSKQVTPIYGVYFLFLVALVIGGTWASCKLRKKRQHGTVPYQELEMALPESSSAINVDDAAGDWDQGWDDDWDEDNAVNSHRFGSISANGLTARSAKKDGWENDWDD